MQSSIAISAHQDKMINISFTKIEPNFFLSVFGTTICDIGQVEPLYVKV